MSAQSLRHSTAQHVHDHHPLENMLFCVIQQSLLRLTLCNEGLSVLHAQEGCQ